VARLTNATRIAQPGFAPVRQPNSLITGAAQAASVVRFGIEADG
jgi:hypothetical protein